MVDVAGLTLTDEEREFLRHPAIGAVILFARNFASKDQVRALAKDIKSLREPALMIAVDQEGGRVQRFREGFVQLPPLNTLGKLYDRSAEQGLSLAPGRRPADGRRTGDTGY